MERQVHDRGPEERGMNTFVIGIRARTLLSGVSESRYDLHVQAISRSSDRLRCVGSSCNNKEQLALSKMFNV